MAEPWTSGPWTTEEGYAEGVGPDPVLAPVAYLVGTDQERFANGRLIEVAPEMADLLGEFIMAATVPGYEDPPIREARDLLARARGEA